MKNIAFEKYTAKQFIKTFGNLYVIDKEVRQLAKARKVEQSVYMCLAEYYEDGKFVDVFNTGYTIMRYIYDDSNDWAVYDGDNIVYIAYDFYDAKAFVINATKDIEY